MAGRVGKKWAIVAMLCLGVASEARAHGDLHEQIVAVTRLLEREPRSAALFHKRGELERAHRDYAAAFQDYDRALELDPALDVVHLSRGRALLETGPWPGTTVATDMLRNSAMAQSQPRSLPSSAAMRASWA